MNFDTTPLSREDADTILQVWLRKPVACRAIRRLHGGMIYSVLALEFDWPPYRAVIKISDGDPNPFEREAYELNYLRSHSRLPVPEVYLCEGPASGIGHSFILLEMLEGVHLGEAKMTQREREQVDRHLADLLSELHGHERETFGSLDSSETCYRWLDYFGPRIISNFEDNKSRLSAPSLKSIPRLLDEMPRIFASQGKPALVHGDIWVTNVMVDRGGGGWAVTGLVDPAARYADVEYELAYLEAFGTVTGAFFERYCQENFLREGYEVRRLYYWLNTMLLHMWLFEDEAYVRRTEYIARELDKLI